jgi:hypothetical protein
MKPDDLTKLNDLLKAIADKVSICPLYSAGDTSSVEKYYEAQKKRTVTIGELLPFVTEAKGELRNIINKARVEEARATLKELGEDDEDYS